MRMGRREYRHCPAFLSVVYIVDAVYNSLQMQTFSKTLMTPVPDAYEIIGRTTTLRVRTSTNKLRLSTPNDMHRRVLGQLLQCV